LAAAIASQSQSTTFTWQWTGEEGELMIAMLLLLLVVLFSQMEIQLKQKALHDVHATVWLTLTAAIRTTPGGRQKCKILTVAVKRAMIGWYHCGELTAKIQQRALIGRLWQ
jgi:hypothetical protein